MRENPILALRQKSVTLTAEMQKLVDKAKDEQRGLSANEDKRWHELNTERARNAARLVEVEGALEIERRTPATARISGNGTDEWQLLGEESDSIPKRGPRKYGDLFGRNLSSGGFRSFGEFAKAFHNVPQQFDPRLKAGNTIGVPSDGGFAVPDQFAAMLMDKALENEVVRPRATVWSMTSSNRKVPALDGFNHTSTLYGGFTAQWVDEAGSITPQKVKTRLLQLTARKLALLGNASNELLADAVGPEGDPGAGWAGIYEAAMTAAIAWFLDEAFLFGDGAAKPLGIFNDPALVSVAKDSSQSSATFILLNCEAMFSRLHPACVANSTWVVNSQLIPGLLAMNYAVPSLRPPLSFDGDQYTLLTRPVVFSEHMKALGTKGDVLLADLSQYAIGLRQGLALERSGHAGFQTDETYFRAITRVDGQGTWKSAVTPKNGDSLSWCVTLDARP
jgi:HK97 family phage major capsid protein